MSLHRLLRGHHYGLLLALLWFASLVVSPISASGREALAAAGPSRLDVGQVIFTHTTQADFMAGERDHLDARGLDALGTPYAYDRDPRGFLRLRSRPGLWTKSPENPVLDTGEPGTWDATVISEAKVIFDGKVFHMWYAGRNRDEPPAGRHKAPMRFGYATSPDGVHWTRYPGNPVLDVGPAGSPDANIVYPPFVLFDGEQFRMWYSAHDFKRWSINYATSPDGAHWTRYSGNPLMVAERDGRWDGNYIAEPCVLFNGEKFEMWYNGGSERTETLRIGYAWSPDGLKWTRRAEDDWVLDVGPLGSWDDFSVARAHVLFDGERYQMWHEGHDGKHWRIGYEVSDDGIHWRPGPDNPVLDLGSAGSWDSVNVAEPNVLFDGTLYRMWYSGYDGDKYRIGLATAPPIYSKRGVFTSPVVDAGQIVLWQVLRWVAHAPAGTGLAVSVRTSSDGKAWSDWHLVTRTSAEGENAVQLNTPPARYLQYQVVFTTGDPARSPVLEEVSGAARLPTPTPTATPTAIPTATFTPTPSPTPTPTPRPIMSRAAGPVGLAVVGLIGVLIGGLSALVLLRRR
ncbi:MAG: hypothetical protein J7M34_12600 [Anaerolineae bacterium]|nr:hypothetical protein [Anaerolineae bacterium]